MSTNKLTVAAAAAFLAMLLLTAVVFAGASLISGPSVYTPGTPDGVDIQGTVQFTQGH